MSKAKAKAKLRAALTKIQAPTVAAVKSETRLRDLGERYLADKAKAGRSARTMESYAYTVRRIIAPQIGDLAVSEAGPDVLQAFVSEVQTTHGAASAKMTKAVLSGMMGIAARSRAVQTNPVRELEAVESNPDGAIAIPLDQLPAVLEKVRADDRLIALDLVALVEFIAGTGARVSEPIAMNWADVDFGAATVTIGSMTKASRRTIAVPPTVIALLRERDVSASPDSPVFVSPLGKRWTSRRVATEWQHARERLGFPDKWTFHAFRKTVGTALDQAGLSARDAAEYLGHENPALTMSIYMSKVVGGDRAALAINSLLTK